MHDRKCRLRVSFSIVTIIIIITFVIIIIKKLYSYSIDAYIDNYNKRMSSLLGDKYMDCYYHLLFIVIIVIIQLLLLFIFIIITFVDNYHYYYHYSY